MAVLLEYLTTLCSEVKDKRKKDLMDPLLIMKDCVDRKKVVDSKKKDKTVCIFEIYVINMISCISLHSIVKKVRNLINTVKALKS